MEPFRTRLNVYSLEKKPFCGMLTGKYRASQPLQHIGSIVAGATDDATIFIQTIAETAHGVISGRGTAQAANGSTGADRYSYLAGAGCAGTEVGKCTVTGADDKGWWVVT